MIVRKVEEILEYVKRLSAKQRQELRDRLEDAADRQQENGRSGQRAAGPYDRTLAAAGIGHTDFPCVSSNANSDDAEQGKASGRGIGPEESGQVRRVFVDSSAFFALIAREDRHHIERLELSDAIAFDEDFRSYGRFTTCGPSESLRVTVETRMGSLNIASVVLPKSCLHRVEPRPAPFLGNCFCQPRTLIPSSVVGREGSACGVRRGSLLQTVQGGAELRVGFRDSRIGSYSQV
jgi:hypothetical protein